MGLQLLAFLGLGLALLAEGKDKKGQVPESGVLSSKKRIDGMEHGIWQMTNEQIAKDLAERSKLRLTPLPEITKVSPEYGHPAGGGLVTIMGENFGRRPVDLLNVTFNESECENRTWETAFKFTCVVPPSPNTSHFDGVGVVDINITTRWGGSSKKINAYYYLLPHPQPTKAKREPVIQRLESVLKPVASEPTSSTIAVSWKHVDGASYYRVFLDYSTLPLYAGMAEEGTNIVVSQLSPNSSFAFKVEAQFPVGKNHSVRSVISDASAPIWTLSEEGSNSEDTFVTFGPSVQLANGPKDLRFNMAQAVVLKGTGMVKKVDITVCAESTGPSGVLLELAMFHNSSSGGGGEDPQGMTMLASGTTRLAAPTEPKACPASQQSLSFKFLEPAEVEAGKRYLLALRWVRGSPRDLCSSYLPYADCEGTKPGSKCEEYPLGASKHCYTCPKLYWLQAKNKLKEVTEKSYAGVSWPPAASKPTTKTLTIHIQKNTAAPLTTTMATTSMPPRTVVESPPVEDAVSKDATEAELMATVDQ